MAELTWDGVGEKVYETGTDHGVLYEPDANGEYNSGVAWNGLTGVTESPSGAEANAQYADNIKYLSLRSAEEYGATIEAFTYPREFNKYDGAAVVGGVTIHQQNRRKFGFSWRTLKGNDVEGTDYGYKLHLAYGCEAAPSEKAHVTTNDSPEATTFSWELDTTPVPVPGTNPDTGKPYRPTAKLTVDSTETDPTALAALEDILYGTAGADPRLPSPEEVIALVGGGAVTTVETEAPTYNPTDDLITIPAVTGVEYYVGEELVTGTYGPITGTTVVTAKAAAGYALSETSDTDWTFYLA